MFEKISRSNGWFTFGSPATSLYLYNLFSDLRLFLDRFETILVLRHRANPFKKAETFKRKRLQSIHDSSGQGANTRSCDAGIVEPKSPGTVRSMSSIVGFLYFVSAYVGRFPNSLGN